MTETKTYRIPEANMGWLMEKLEGLNKKARKCHTTEIQMTVVGEETVTLTNAITGFDRLVVYKIVEVTGETPKLNGWTFVARLEKVASTANLVFVAPGEALPEIYRSADTWCDHCQTRRTRKDTFVVRNDEGTYKQVGKTCLRDFLGHQDPMRVANMAEWMATFAASAEEAEEEDFRGRNPRHENGWSTEQILQLAALCIRKHGWVSQTEARNSTEDEPKYATVVNVTGTLSDLESKDERNHRDAMQFVAEMTDGDRETATKTLEWVKGFEDNLNDYQHNLKTIATVGYVTYKTMGMMVSAVAGYMRQAERELRRATATNEHIGTVGKREVFTLTLVAIRQTETAYGLTTIYKFEDVKGNKVVWFSSNDELVQGKTYEIKATVKAHNVFKGTNETAITRGTVQREVR